jgi:hypothetical protein
LRGAETSLGAMPQYIAERYEPGIAASKLQEDARRLADAVSTMRAEGAAIELLGLTFVPGDEGAFSRFECPSVELVVEAHKRAAVPFERIVEALPVAIENGETE